VTIFTISLQQNDDSKIRQSTFAADVSASIVVRRSELENHFRKTVFIRGTLEQGPKDLDRVGDGSHDERNW